MSLDPKIVLSIDKARMEGQDPMMIHEAVEKAGHDADAVFAEYSRMPLPDGRLRGQVNLGDRSEWANVEAPRSKRGRR